MHRPYQNKKNKYLRLIGKKYSAFIRLGALVTLMGLAGCASEGEQVDYQPYFAEDNPSTLVDSYMIAHGMAQGRVMAGGMTLPGIKHLIRQDYIALLTVVRQVAEPSEDHLKAAHLQVRKLLTLIDANGQKYMPPASYNVAPPAPSSHHHALTP